MKLLQDACTRVLPRRLMHQVLVLAALVIILSGTLYSVIAARRIDEMGRLLLEAEAAGLAHSVASGGALHLVNGDPAGLERLLLKSAGYPGVRTITVSNAEGRIAAAVKQDRIGNPVADFDLQAMPVPSMIELQQPARVELGGEAVIEAYAEVENGSRLGWVRVTVGVERAALVSANARRDTLIGVLCISLLTLAALYAFFMRALQPLARCIEFAGRLGHSLGETLQLRHATVESEALGQALNAASRELDGRMTALALSEARVRQILNTSMDGVVCMDGEGLITDWSVGAEQIFGYTAEQACGRVLAELIIPRALRQAHADGMQRFLQTGHAAVLGKRIEISALHANGSQFEIELSIAHIPRGGKHFFNAFVRDISERKRSETALRQFKSLVNASDDAIISKTLDGIVLSWNPGAERLFGYAAESMIGELIKVIVPSERQAEMAAMIDALSKGAKVASAETVRLHRDGYLIDVSSTLSPILDEAGKLTGVSEIARNITERKAAQAAQVALEGQLRESQKMEAIGTLAGGIAHDFNNIIATILGNAELAIEDAAENPQRVRESVEEILKAGRRGRDVVQQILSFSRRQPTARQPVKLDTVVAECAHLLRASFPARVVLDVHCDDAVAAVLADVTQIQQVLINLATNAMLAMQGGAGRVEIRLDTVTLDAALAGSQPQLAALNARHPGRIIRLSVRDDGVGMAPETLAKIFEPFFTTRPPGAGTGLGLSVVHGIVQTHEGAITVESTWGKGTTFTVYLPPDPNHGASLSPVKKPATEERNEGAGRHILYLDDEEALVFLVKRLLRRRGYRVSGYSSQSEALAALNAAPDSFDMVVTDYNMPGMSGLDVACEVRALCPGLPVVIATGFVEEDLPRQAALAGVSEVIFKATEVDALCETLVRVLKAFDAKRAAHEPAAAGIAADGG